MPRGEPVKPITGRHALRTNSKDNVATIVDQLPASLGRAVSTRRLLSRDASAQRHMDQMCKGVRAHLFHDASAMDFDGTLTDSQLISDDLVGRDRSRPERRRQ